MRRAFKFAAGFVLIMATLTPLAEFFDRWDHNVAPANDSELNVAAWFAGVGLVLTLGTLLKYVPNLGRPKKRPSRAMQIQPASRLELAGQPGPTASPPLISLRI